MSDTEIQRRPVARGDTIWVVTTEGTIHSYSFVEEATNYRGESMLLLAYGTHPKQRNYYPAKQCVSTRQAACVMAAKTLRYRGEMCVARAKELEREAAGIPWIPKEGNE